MRFLIQSFDPTRTMLGAAQLDQLEQSLVQAQQRGVVWKFIADEQIDNVVFVSADVHGTLVNNLTYQVGPFQPQLATGAFEVVSGSALSSSSGSAPPGTVALVRAGRSDGLAQSWLAPPQRPMDIAGMSSMVLLVKMSTNLTSC